MSDVWKADLVGELAACGLASIFFGSAVCCSVVSIPTILSHSGSKAKLDCWSGTFELAKVSQSIASIFAGLIGVGLYQFKEAPKEFAYGGACFLAMMPYTLIVLLPLINNNKDLRKKLQEDNRLDHNEEFGKSAVAGIQTWGNGHHVRTVFGGIGLGLMLRGLARYGN